MLARSGNPLSDRIFPEQVRLLYRGAREAYIATVVNAALLVFIQVHEIAARLVVLWFVYILLITAGRALLVYAYWRSDTQSEHALTWNRLYVIGSALAGIGWGAAGILLYPPGSLAHQVFLAFVIGGMGAGSVAALTARLEPFFAFFLPGVIPIAIRFGVHGDPFHTTMTVMILLYIGALLVGAYRLHRTIRSALALRCENADLVRHLMGAKEQADELNESLKNEIIERRKTEVALRESQEQLELKVQERTRELQRKHAQLLQASKLASIGELATGVAHELNNPLNNIGLIAGNLLQAVQHVNEPARGSLLTNLGIIDRQVAKAAQIISHLRTFGRAAGAEKTAIRLHDVLTAALVLMDQQLRLNNIHVHLAFSEEHPVVRGNAIQLEQVFVNLLSNACDSLKQSVAKTVSLTTRLYGDAAEVIIQDSGHGIASEDLQRIFDPFFTTKAVGSGTGLGLSISYGIIQDHGGTIVAESRAGDGAMFTLRFPLVGREV
jgi:signal transduction histidine kinase